MSKNHYVYYSYEEWGHGYIGVRSTKLDPWKDPYMGSFKDRSFKPTRKEIIAIFRSRKEALEAEIILHDFYKVHLNSHFANKAKQTSTGFSQEGIKGRKWWNNGKQRKLCEQCPGPEYERGNLLPGQKGSFYGKTLSIKARQKLSEYAKNRIGKKSPMYGKTHSKDARRKISEFRKTCIGEKNHMFGKRGENSPIFGITRNEETRKKISEYAKKCRWWTDGVSLKRCPDQPGPEWKPGRIKKI